MKYSVLYLITIGLIGCTNFQSREITLPVPDKKFIQMVKNEENAEEAYFTKYLGKESENIINTYTETTEPCAVVYKFKTGIIFKRSFCSESGTEAEIIFPHYSKTEVTNFVEWFFKTDYNSWDNSKSKYQPIEEGEPGCYFEINEGTDSIILTYYCGC